MAQLLFVTAVSRHFADSIDCVVRRSESFIRLRGN